MDGQVTARTLVCAIPNAVIVSWVARRLETMGKVLIKTIGEFVNAEVAPANAHQLESNVEEHVRELARSLTEWSFNSLEPKNVEAMPTRTSEKAAQEYFDLFEQEMSIDDIANQLDRTVDTVSKYPAQYLRAHRITDIDQLVTPEMQLQINAALGQHGHVRLKPIFEHLDGQVDYARIRVVATVWEMQHE